MRAPLRQTALTAAAFASGAFALGHLQVDHATVGSRTLILTVDDSIKAPDLAKLRIDGYAIENALFVEESDSGTRFAPGYVDMTDSAQGRILEYAPGPGTVSAEFPSWYIPRVGAVLGDTSFGGLLRKVTEVDPQSRPGARGRIWNLRTVEAGLQDAVLDCDISFRTRMDFNQALADVSQSQDWAGTSLAFDPADGDSAAAFGHLDIALKSSQILFQPAVTGRIRIRGGNVEVFNVQVAGECDVMASIEARVTGAGEFEFEEELPGRPPQILPLGGGLFVRMRQRPFLRVESRSPDEEFSAQAEFRIRNAIKGELGFSERQWRPLAENKMSWSAEKLAGAGGEGELKLTLKPRVEMLLEGAHGPVFTFGSFARLTGARAAGPVPQGAPVNPPPVNREASVGADIHMETRTTFLGPSDSRDFLLFLREQNLLAPPKEGTLFLKEADSNRLVFQCATFPKSDAYVIQQKLGSGPWETVLDRVSLPHIPLASLKPGGAYRFRAIGVNASGYGPAFPPEGIPYQAPIPDQPPYAPLAVFPDSAAVLPDTQPMVLSWRGGDPDSGDQVRYSVYLDTRFPPVFLRADGLADTSLAVYNLRPGTTYYWKVVADDGRERSEGAVRSFLIERPKPLPPRPAGGYPAEYPLVYIPKGDFRREDGKIVQVGPFFLGKYEVTQEEYAKVVGRNPSYHLQDSLPVDRVTWGEADAYCRETGGRLPTEAEWEYAARAGSATAFYWKGADPGGYAWYRDNSENRTWKVGLKKPNGWGLYDMAGNVFEWVQDWYADYDPADVDHPKGPAAGTAKVIRGASWYSEAASLSLSARYNNRPGFRNFKVGFRCARDSETALGAAFPTEGAVLAGNAPLPRPEVSAPK